MPFTNDWFSNNIGNWTRWLASLRDHPAHVLEIGCYEGRATCWLLENVLTHPASRVVVIDTFEGSEEHVALGVPFAGVKERFISNVAPWKERVSVFTGPSQQVLRHFHDERFFDFIYIDGSHQAADVLADACLVWPLLRDGGTLVFDDYGWKGFADPRHCPQLAIDAFLAVYDAHLTLVAREYQVAVVKLA